jgi:transcriptional regulator with XRE-family HTH domain
MQALPASKFSMTKRLISHLRALRDKAALTQPELAKLLGKKKAQTVSRYELQNRPPPIHIALALQVVFGRSPAEIFAGAYEQIEDATMRRAAKLLGEIDGEDDVSRRKRKLLSEMPKRARGSCRRA